MTKLPAAAHRLMSQQHGVASARQLVDTGLTTRQLQHLADTGQLIHLVRGAYASPSRAIDELARCAALCLARRDAGHRRTDGWTPLGVPPRVPRPTHPRDRPTTRTAVP